MVLIKKTILIGLLFYFFLGCSPLAKQGWQRMGKGIQRTQHTRIGSVGKFPKLNLSFLITPMSGESIRVSEVVSFQLVFWREGEGSVADPFLNPELTPYIELWMAMAGGGHGSHDVTVSRFSQDNSGIFKIDGVVFNMASIEEDDWEFQISLKDNDGNLIEKAVQTITVGIK